MASNEEGQIYSTTEDVKCGDSEGSPKKVIMLMHTREGETLLQYHREHRF